MSGTHKVTVVSDGLSYRIPGQDKPAPGQHWLVMGARRGDDIDITDFDYDRLKAHGAIADQGTKEAGLAKAGPITGPPANAVRISGENDNLPIDKLRQQAREAGLLRDDEDTDETPPPSGEPPVSIDLADQAAVEQLNVAQLKALAGQQGVEITSSDLKADIVKKLVKKGKGS